MQSAQTRFATAFVAVAVAMLLALPAARADESPALRAAHREKIIGIALGFVGLAISMTGGVFAIVNHGFDRDTHTERVYFGLSVGLAAGAAPIVTTGVTLWAQGAVRERRERARLRLALDGVRVAF